MIFKNTKTFIFTIITIFIFGNILLFTLSFFQQKKYNKNLIIQQSEAFTSLLEQNSLSFINDINQLAYYFSNVSNINDLIKNSPTYLNKIKFFYIKHQSLINNIFIIDTSFHVLSVYRDSYNNFITDYYESKQIFQLYSKEKLTKEDEIYRYIVPIFHNNVLIANLFIVLDLSNFLSKQLQPLYTGNSIFQVIALNKSSYIAVPLFKFSYTNKLINSIESFRKDSSKIITLVTRVNLNNEKKPYLVVLSAFHFIGLPLIFIYHYDIQHIVSSILINSSIIIIFNLLLIIVIIFYYLQLVKTRIAEEDKLRESEEAFKDIIESMPIGIIITKKDNRVLKLNKTAARILQIHNANDIIGTNINHKFLTTKALAFGDDLISAFETDHFIQYNREGEDIVLYKKDIPLRLKGEDVVVQSFIDITPLEKSRKREIAANMAKSEFLAKMSHEIRTPMNGIIGMADALMQQQLTPEQIEFVTIIKKSADLLLNILNDILDLSKIEAGKMILEEIPFELRKELKLIVNLFRLPIEDKKLKLELHIDENVPDKLIGDPFRLRQIINNLINNAIKFTHEGKIVLSVKKLEEYNRNLMLQFKVADTGIGISKDKIDKVFESFSQADNSTTRKYGGTGLGTTIAKQLVELMNGEISVESPSGISVNPKYPGCCFTFSIELFSNEKVDKNVPIDSIIYFDQIKTLMISNNHQDDKTIAETFSFFNVHVEIHNFNKSTISYLKNIKSTEGITNRYVLLIIRDTLHFDAFKFLARLQEAQLINDFYILIISNNDKPGNYLRSLRMGADHYIIVPYETSEIFNFLCETFSHIKLEEEVLKFKVYQLKPDLNILVAEDNPINKKVALTLFKNIGYEVDFAYNGIEVLEQMNKKHYDIIFMDIQMPEMDGIQATQEIRKRGFQIPIIAMTANISKDERKEALEAGMNDYVTKPVRIDTIKKILIKLFSEESKI